MFIDLIMLIENGVISLKNIRNVALLMLFIILLSGCSSKSQVLKGNSSADWAFHFVIWSNDLYEVTSELVLPEEIETEIGQVKKYSDIEGTYKNGFSNRFKEGTKLYKLNDVAIDKYLAAQIGTDQYVKLENTGKYGRK